MSAQSAAPDASPDAAGSSTGEIAVSHVRAKRRKGVIVPLDAKLVAAALVPHFTVHELERIVFEIGQLAIKRRWP